MADDLQTQLDQRRRWFFETQLRGLNMSTFAGLRLDRADALQTTLLKLISEAPVGDRPAVYLDSQEPVWTVAEGLRRAAFAGTMIGRHCNWLEYQEPKLVIEALAGLAEEFVNDRFASELESSTAPAPPGTPPPLGTFRRRPADWDGKGRALARAAVAEARPWLIPELYYPMNPPEGQDVRALWLGNLETFVLHVEYELQRTSGGGTGAPPTISDPAGYATWVLTAMGSELRAERVAAAVALGVSETEVEAHRSDTGKLDPEKLRRISTENRVTLLDVSYPSDYDPGDPPDYAFDPRDATTVPAGKLGEHFSTKARYWSKVVNGALGEVHLNKPDSDMGLCLLVRTLYLHGTIPEHVASADTVRGWRHRTQTPETQKDFDDFFARRIADDYFQIRDTMPPAEKEAKQAELGRMKVAVDKLRILVQVSAEIPNAASIVFSPIVGEALRQGLHHYKFWLDEVLRALDNEKLQKARTDIGAERGWGDDIAETEMEYWSENHYIMFASSEYLAGQLWEYDEFQPGKEFLDGATTGVMSGRDREKRGKARVLKWLNHRLMFGWTEFHSSGYLREHLWALVNLADFAMDDEVRKKAEVVTDLLLFDIARFQHRGAMGAAGGRSQFKSKACGWDNGPGDAVELLFGTRGMFTDEDSEIGSSLATSAYKAPDVLVEIGSRDKPPSAPPTGPPTPDPWELTFFEDRARVSITFDEAYKYGIWFSQESDEVTSRREGYQPKLERHFQFIDQVNTAIANSHTNYGAHEDSTVFWWTTSSFVNKQVVAKSLECAERFGLDKTGVWAQLPALLKTYIPIAKGLGLGGFFYGAVQGTAQFVAGLGPIGGLLELINYGDAEDIADEFAPLLDGSSRTRANILTYGNGDVMLSSIQDFRPGQLNYQSNVSQVTLNRALNVFTTGGFAGADLSPITAGMAGLLAGGVAGAVVGSALLGPVGAAGALIVDEAFIEGENLLGSEGDGPGWWTGYWALPMIVQHRGASILAYKFPDAQTNLAEAQSHLWFPKKGFALTDQQRCAAYEDDNSVFEEPFDYSKNGHWVFGKIAHPAPGVTSSDWSEAYVGVFSNKRPDWLDVNEDADVYATQVSNAIDKAEDDIDEIDGKIDDLDEKIAKTTDADEKHRLEDEKKRLQTDKQDKNAAWGGFAIQVPLFEDWVQKDYFSDKDWNVEGDNIWIIQVGNKSEFGDFETFKDRVRRAKVVVDDTGGLECTYHMPLPGTGNATLKLDYDDDDFTLDGAAVQVDLYPRFDSPFIRGQNNFPLNNRVEWGQRSYVIAYRGKELLHDFHDFTDPVRRETAITARGSASNTVRALVIFARTGGSEMEEFTRGTATVTVGCATVADGDVIAVGPIGEDTVHDAEWIFLDGPTQLSPDLTLELTHRAFGDGDNDSEWDVSFSVKALMADQRLLDCEFADSSVHFEGDSRRSQPLPFTVKSDVWRDWDKLDDARMTGTAVLVGRPSWRATYYDHCDLLTVAKDRPVRHRRVQACLDRPAEWAEIPSASSRLAFDADTPVHAFSRSPGHVAAFTVSANRLFSASADNMRWSPWTEGVDVAGSTPQPVPFASPGSLFAAPSLLTPAGAELVATGSDGHLYANFAWQPGRRELWRRVRVQGFPLRQDGVCVVAGNRVFALAVDGGLWAAAIDRVPTLPTDPVWKKISPPETNVRNFTVVDLETGPVRLLAVSTTGGLWDVTVPQVDPPQWHRLATPWDHTLPEFVRVAHGCPEPDRLDIFLTDSGTVHTASWKPGTGWEGWRPLVEGDAGFVAADRNPLVIHRVKRQLEVLAETTDGDLMRTWWS